MVEKRFRTASALLLLPALLSFSASGPAYGDEGRKPSAEVVVITPEPTDEILANPGMGWETFHHTSRQDPNLPSWIPSTVQYIRWSWAALEPQPVGIDYALLDRALKESRDSGQKLALRVMCCSTARNTPYHPAWLKDVGGKERQVEWEGTPFPVPDLDDPATLRRHLSLIRRLGERYDGHPDLDHVDIGSIGWWGEWHFGNLPEKLPRLENRGKVVDAYRAAFKKTPLLMLIGGHELLRYATGRGTGWRADCLGDLGGFSKDWCLMRQGYPSTIRDSGIRDVWKTAPVAWETCWEMRKWVEEGWSLRYIFNYALALHGSYINNKSAPLPAGDDVRPELERFLRRLGYRLVLTELRHPSRSTPGTKLVLRMKWQNVGSAPCYKPYRLAYRLTSAQGYRKLFTGAVRVNRWLPGSIDPFTDDLLREPKDLPPGKVVAVTDTMALPIDIPAGIFDLAVAVVDESPSDPDPVVRLAIKGRDKDGWYPLTQVRVDP
jgi:hypothetical protein